MPINFPSNPATNDVYTYGGRSWKFNGTGWETTNPSAANAGGDLTGTYPNPTIANGAVTAAKLASGVGGMQLLDSQTFSSSTTYAMPAAAKIVSIEVYGPGGGGGSGANRNTFNTASANGGQGGGGGGVWFGSFSTSALSLNGTVTITVGAGGTGGASVTTSGANGNSGTQGGITRVGDVYMLGGMPGLYGQWDLNTPADTTDPSIYTFIRPAARAAGFIVGTSSAVAGERGYLSGGAGGGGGGVDQSALNAGAAGGKADTDFTQVYSSGRLTGGGGIAGATGSAGGAATANSGGGGGGGGGRTSAGTAGAGGAGASPGGGGGGGGGGATSASSGAGGAGGAGRVRIWVYG